MASDLNALKQALTDILTLINDDFMEKQAKYVLGNNPTSPTSIDNKIGALFNIENFTDLNLGVFKYKQGISESALPGVYVRDSQSQGYNIRTTNFSGLKDDFVRATNSNPLIDINITNWIERQTTNNSQTQNTDDTRKFLNGLYLWHDLCHVNKWNDFKLGSSVTLKSGDLDANNQNITITCTKSNVPEPLSLILNPNDIINTSVNMYMLQRMFYVLIRLFQFKITMSVLNDKFPLNNDVQQKELMGVPAAILTLLEQDISRLTEVMKDMNADITERKTLYNDFNSKVSDIDTAVDVNKAVMNRNMDRIRAESSYEGRMKAFMIASFVVLVLVLVGSAVIHVMPFEHRIKLIGYAVIVITVGLSALLLSFVQSKTVIEGFNATIDNTFSSVVYTSLEKQKIKELYSLEMYRLVVGYLERCFNFTHSMNVYQTMGNVTYTMAKELRYFTDTNNRMQLTGEKMRNEYRASDLAQKQYNSSMYFFISVGIIVSATLLAYNGFASFGGVQTIALIAGGIILLIAIIIYILEYSGYVRTDGDKKYWGQPVNASAMQSI